MNDRSPKGGAQRRPGRVHPNLRIKLTLWYLSIYAGLQVVLVAGALLLRGDELEQSAENELYTRSLEIARALSQEPPPITDERLAGALPAEVDIVVAAVRRPDRGLMAVYGIEPEALPDIDRGAGIPWPRARELSPEERSLFPEEADSLRRVQVPFIVEGNAQLSLQLIGRLDPWARFLDVFSGILALGFPIGLVAAGVACWLIAGRAVSPYQRLAEAARGVHPGTLDARIDVHTEDPEVVQLQQELNLALERLESGHRAQQRFLDNVSHELKSPIAVLLTETQVLLHTPAEEASMHEHLRSVEEEMMRLGQIVESILALARTQAGSNASRRGWVAVEEFVTRSVENCRPLAEAQEVLLTAELAAELDQDDAPAGLFGDAQLLGAMLDNLLRNAIRFSPKESTVHLRGERRVDSIQLSVSDSGPGLPEAMIEGAFEPYVRVPAEDQGRAEGTGLGLSIARSIARMHGGNLRAENLSEGGASFCVELPLTFGWNVPDGEPDLSPE